jgi:hypothetical protein
VQPDPLPSMEPALNTDVSIHDQGRDPASLASCDSPDDELNSDFVEPTLDFDEGREGRVPHPIGTVQSQMGLAQQSHKLLQRYKYHMSI